MPITTVLTTRRLRAGAVAAPAAAQAGIVGVDRSCYAEGAPVIVGGAGFTPGSTVSISGSGLSGTAPVRPDGTFVYAGNAPTGFSVSRPGSETLGFTVIDGHGVTQRGSLRVAPLAMKVKPSRANPRRRVRWTFSGFPQGSTIYSHVSRGGRTFNHRFGRAHGPCGILSTHARLLPVRARRVRMGVYRIQVDTNPTRISGALPRLEFGFRVYKVYR
jgi:hypothetical protein